ncbi:thymidine phosphorylase [Methylopila sp. Yamaguchi]|uniref:thymidine phosphorylase n=1 Tax=Methylopila sp. Yamaguchi TaxID=1437817 RepID=UPI000CC94137|nr:thymidine phosphorylase [Methylopila sp. Yamaguchi]GBD50723.1 thymidine phosphorylase [Methylopila sp. Yamaguchi]
MASDLPPQELLRRKRDGARLSAGEIGALVAGVASGSLSDAQVGAFAMAAFLRGLDRDETVALTRAMTASGRTLSWDDLPGPVVDKHSTGGVGDTVSLLLAPALAACGAHVPMIAGRGLGHTGGTVDKLEAIPGYAVRPALDALRATVRDVGCAIVGQTPDLAPADGRLYAIRDVTGTVEAIPLLTSSILSKKLAAGLGGLAMDVKTGSGAFLPDDDDARRLATSLVEVARGAGLPTVALLTDMDQPLANVAGNALETAHAVAVLAGRRSDARLMEVTLALGAEALLLAGLTGDAAAGRAALERAFASGAAAERFARMVAALGGPIDLMERPDAHLAGAPVVVEVAPETPGRVVRIEVRALGLAVVGLGGGRTRPDQTIDPAVGLDRLAPVGAEVGPERPLARVHARDAAAADRAAAAVRRAYEIGVGAVAERPLIQERIA